MTILVGVRCTDGLVIGADSKATEAIDGLPFVQIQSNQKLRKVGDRILYATTGSVGLGQRFGRLVEGQWNSKGFQGDHLACVTKLCRSSLQEFHNTFVPGSSNGNLPFGALFGAVIDQRPCLVEFGGGDFQPEIKDERLYCASMGSGKSLADPFLAFVNRVLWKNEMPTVDQAKMGVYWVLDHTIKYAPGGVGDPICLGTIRGSRQAWSLDITDNTQEQSQYINELEAKIGEGSLIDAAASTLPPVPPSGA